jgi:hypothetical protein
MKGFIMAYISRKDLKEIFNKSDNPNSITFDAFYGRVRQLGWSVEKSLNYKYRPIKKKQGETNVSKSPFKN